MKGTHWNLNGSVSHPLFKNSTRQYTYAQKSQPARKRQFSERKLPPHAPYLD